MVLVAVVVVVVVVAFAVDVDVDVVVVVIIVVVIVVLLFMVFVVGGGGGCGGGVVVVVVGGVVVIVVVFDSVVVSSFRSIVIAVKLSVFVLLFAVTVVWMYLLAHVGNRCSVVIAGRHTQQTAVSRVLVCSLFVKQPLVIIGVCCTITNNYGHSHCNG